MAQERSDLIGKALGGYEITAELASGGMGTVYKARHTRLDKIVAIKVLSPKMQLVDEYVERFHREAMLAAKLEHPNIVSIYDYGQHDDIFYFVMQFVEGESLSERMGRDPQLEIQECLRIVTEISKGLERAHESGLVHRDIKPENILISSRGEVMITDFGLVKQDTAALSGTLTSGGTILGTPTYMAPEQCQGLPDVDGRADIYSLGLILYEMLTGRVAAIGETAMMIMQNRLMHDVPGARTLRPGLAPELDLLLARLLMRDPDQRLGSARELLAALAQLPPHVVIEGAGAPLPYAPPTPAFPLPPTGGQLGHAAPNPMASGSLLGGPMASGAMPGPPPTPPVNIATPPEIPDFGEDLLGPGPEPGEFANSTRITRKLRPVTPSSLISGAHAAFAPPPMPPAPPGGAGSAGLGGSPSGGMPAFTDSGTFLPPEVEPRPPLNVESGFHHLNTQTGSQASGVAMVAARPGGGVRTQQTVLVLAALTLLLALGLVAIVLSRPSQVAITSLTGSQAWTTNATLTLEGQASHGPVTVTVAGQPSPSRDDGRFQREIILAEGRNEIAVEVLDGYGNRSATTVLVTLDSIAPQLSIAGELRDQVVIDEEGVLRGLVKDKHPHSVIARRRDGLGAEQTIEVREDGRFELRLEPFRGAVAWQLTARDKAGNESSREVQVRSITELRLEFLEEPTPFTSERRLTLEGRASFGPVTVSVQGIEARTTPDGEFSVSVRLEEGENRLPIALLAGAGLRKDVREVIVIRDDIPPDLTIPDADFSDQVLLGADGILKGAVKDRNLAALEVDGRPIAVDGDGRFSLNLSGLRGRSLVTLIARDKAGNERRKDLRVAAQGSLLIEMLQAVPAITREAQLTLSGQVKAIAEMRLTLDVGVTVGEVIPTNSEGMFSTVVELAEGRNELRLKVLETGGREAEWKAVVVRDTAAPVLQLDGLNSRGELILQEGGALRGRVRDKSPVELRVGEETVELREDGEFELPLTLTDGREVLKIKVTDRAGNARELEVLALNAAALNIDLDPLPEWSREPRERLRGRVTQLPAQLELNGEPLTLDSGGRFDVPIPLRPGANELRLRARSESGLTQERTVVLRYDAAAPEVSFDGEAGPGQVAVDESGALAGLIVEDNLATLTVDGREVEVDAEGRFRVEVGLERRSLVVRVEDAAGRVLERRVEVGPESEFQSAAVISALADLESWRNAPTEVQDAAIGRALERLGPGWKRGEVAVYTCGGQRLRIATLIHAATEMAFQLIPGGRAIMGSPSGDMSEQPAHEVRIPPFLMAKVEALQREWAAVEGVENPSHFPGLARPVEKVSFEALTAWLEALGAPFRLPSEAEWEYACRAGTTTPYFWGPEWDESYVWYVGNNRENYSRQARPSVWKLHDRNANAFGLVDMLGNVKEWCADDYIGGYRDGPSDAAPRRSAEAREKVVRGGSWRTDRTFCTSYARFRHEPVFSSSDLGFRLAVSLEWEAAPEPARGAAAAGIELLDDIGRWQRASSAQQDAAIAEVLERLGAAYRLVETRVYSCAGVSARIATILHIPTEMALQLVPGRAGEVEAFLIGRFELTQGQWDRFSGEDARSWRGPARPLEGVSWSALQAWLEKAGDGLRLPLDLEWTHAARAGSASSYYWGSSYDPRYCWTIVNANENTDEEARPHVGAEHASRGNAFGLVDVLGNVWEWVADADGDQRIARGGSWFKDPKGCTLESRAPFDADHRFKDLGARIAVSIPR